MEPCTDANLVYTRSRCTIAKYFTATETDGLKQRLVVLLDQMRDKAEIPITITCGYRSSDRNKEVGGVPDSEHTKGEAVDIRCHDSVTRFKLVRAAFLVGFKRIEIGTRHLHLGIGEDKPQNVLWLGESK